MFSKHWRVVAFRMVYHKSNRLQISFFSRGFIVFCGSLREEHQLLLAKLSKLEKKVIVGGVDLLAKAEEQERLLQESNKELEERRKRAELLSKKLVGKEVETV